MKAGQLGDIFGVVEKVYEDMGHKMIELREGQPLWGKKHHGFRVVYL